METMKSRPAATPKSVPSARAARCTRTATAAARSRSRRDGSALARRPAASQRTSARRTGGERAGILALFGLVLLVCGWGRRTGQRHTWSPPSGLGGARAMLLLLGLGVPQRPLAALEADLADFEAVLERGGEGAGADLRLGRRADLLGDPEARAHFRALQVRRRAPDRVAPLLRGDGGEDGGDAAPETAHALCIKQHATKAEPEPSPARTTHLRRR